MSWYPVVQVILEFLQFLEPAGPFGNTRFLMEETGPTFLNRSSTSQILVMGPLIHSFFHGDDCSCATQVVFVLDSYDTSLFLCDIFPGNSSRVVTFESSTTPQPFHNVSSTKKPSLSGSTTSAEFNFRAKSSKKARAYS